MTTTLISNNKTTLYTTFYPKSECDTVILLHGGPGVPDEFSAVAEFLSGKFQVISFHQRGTGLSPCPDGDYSMESYISDIDCIADHFNIQKFHLFGHSWGGLYAQIYTQQRPEKVLSLFLCSPASGTGFQWKETEAEILKYNRSKCSLSEWLGMGINSLLVMLGSDTAIQRLFKQVIKNYNRGFSVHNQLSFNFQFIKAAPNIFTRKQITKYPLLRNATKQEFKITITYGDYDIYGNSKRYVKERYPKAAFNVIAHSGHFPWAHNKNDFFKVLADHYKI